MLTINSSNTSDHEGPDDQQIPWTLWLRGVIGVITVLGNLLVILLILTRPSLRTTPNWFVLSLAVADFLVGLVIISIALVFIFLYPFKGYGVYFVLAIHDFVLYASTSNLCALTLNRYIRIVHPLKQNLLRKKSNVVMLLAFSWTVAFLLPFILLVLRIFIQDSKVIRSYSTFLLCLDTFPCVFLPVAYCRVLCVVQHQRAQITRQMSQLRHNYPVNSNEREMCENNKRSANVLGGVIAFFVITNVLYTVGAWLHFLGIPTQNSTLSRISLLLLNTNSVNNIFVYGLFKKDFREEMAKVFCRKLGNRVGSTRSFGSPTKRIMEM
ncbi:5-hydroxytryptamine receptor 2C-like [Actinia tenebrosa]|uniref:5-hydroxytryptamine receptor 2C-like n=1 Tax=Actinia tenebrosa TaxID=6105 RepID=A0A6P8J4X5_ACTTE|nr:5-hydroxytryptamine receptor 2C-like [Actinia tenebrosa]